MHRLSVSIEASWNTSWLQMHPKKNGERAQLKKAYQSGEYSLVDLDSIWKFAQEFFCIRRMCENMFGALEIVGAKEEKQKERETGEVVC